MTGPKIKCLIVLTTFLIRKAIAGYGEVWQEMNWIYNNEEFFENEDNYEVTDSGLKFALLPHDDVNADGKYADKISNREEIKRGDVATVMYKLYLHPTTKKDRRRHLYSQANLQRAFDVTLGAGVVIKGFDEALYKMKVGDKGCFYLPPHIGYGKEGQPGFQIPGDATLIYYLELVKHTPRRHVHSRYGDIRDSGTFYGP